MVSHVSAAVDDAVYERAKQVKDDRNLSWSEFIAVATEELERAG